LKDIKQIQAHSFHGFHAHNNCMKLLQKKYMTPIIILAVCLGLWMLYGYLSIRNIEKPTYSVSQTLERKIEIREYAPMIVAATTVDGPYDEAVNNGFRIIADYIFGNNTSKGSIAMTSPVIQESSSSIAMTTPVLQEKNNNETFTIRFVMPSKYTMETIPKPNNVKVTLAEVPSRTIATIMFSGLWSNAKAEKYTALLGKVMDTKGYKIISNPQYARYNPPWTPPWMRLNEIWVEVSL